MFGEVAIFVGPQFVITVRHGDAPEAGAGAPAARGAPGPAPAWPDWRSRYAIVDHVVDGYEPVVAGLENDIDEIEDEVFSGSPTVSRRIYELTREVIEFQRATGPLSDILGRLIERARGRRRGADGTCATSRTTPSAPRSTPTRFARSSRTSSASTSRSRRRRSPRPHMRRTSRSSGSPPGPRSSSRRRWSERSTA